MKFITGLWVALDMTKCRNKVSPIKLARLKYNKLPTITSVQETGNYMFYIIVTLMVRDFK